ncbi:hypothetical protein E2C01_022854 [Portunus trituberculatus]|uniref:Uncharacterized protein n=1 Tax=Portunus trituberculatus TaxID=210409 RepID=A0A5B7E9L8_PORTR|nr:hypothetical protein [Portunus trituberculatus]
MDRKTGSACLCGALRRAADEMTLTSQAVRQVPVVLLRLLVVVLVRETAHPRYDSTENLLPHYDFIIGTSTRMFWSECSRISIRVTKQFMTQYSAHILLIVMCLKSVTTLGVTLRV